jgi:hypothetical protein
LKDFSKIANTKSITITYQSFIKSISTTNETSTNQFGHIYIFKKAKKIISAFAPPPARARLRWGLAGPPVRAWQAVHAATRHG